MNRVLIVTNEAKDPQHITTGEVKEAFTLNGWEVILCDNESRKEVLRAFETNDFQLVIVIGGDGTLIEVARHINKTEIPLLGINMGTLGYLTEVETCDVYEAVLRIVNGEYEIEKRMMIEGMINEEKEVALNDIVVSRREGLRVIHFDIFVNGEFLNSYQADGIILSTPTGSTAYNLSAGGPIVEPTAALLLLTPICSHALNTSSIVLSAEDEVVVRIGEGRNQTIEKASVAFDGTDTHTLYTGDEIIIRRAETKTNIIKLSKMSFLETLRRKMKGS